MFVCVTLCTVYYDAVEVCLDQLCPTEIFYWATNYVITFCDSHLLNDFHYSKKQWFFWVYGPSLFKHIWWTTLLCCHLMNKSWSKPYRTIQERFLKDIWNSVDNYKFQVDRPGTS